MIKTCMLTIVLLPLFISLSTSSEKSDFSKSDSNAANEQRTTHDIPTASKSGNVQDVLVNLHALLRDPIDEEHDELESDSHSGATHVDEWTIQIHQNDDKTAKDLADSYGFDVVSRLDVGKGVFRFLNKKSLQNQKKTVVNSEESAVENEREVKKEAKNEESYYQNEKRELLLHELAKRLGADERVLWYKRERILKREKRVPVAIEVSKHDEESNINRDVKLSDPQFTSQWYIKNDGQTTGPAQFDSNIVPVWNMGYTGKGVSVSVLDDGMDHTHPDLKDNYDPEASTDLNGHDRDPFPNDSDPYNAHGTKCSGTIAAKANNAVCGVGIAFNCKIGAIRMLDGKATDGLEANALSFNRDHIDIYSCSWGPKDNGKTFGRPGKLGRIAFEHGAKYGRNGKGSLFVWATGNGGRSMDDCNADGYVNNIYTMGIGSVNEHGVSTYYGERCSAMFAVTYCSGRHSSRFGKNAHADVITTYLHHQCTKHFVGTSSAAPLAAGIFALVLEANANLTWRDVQHLIFHTTKLTSPLDEGWHKNGCGKPVNHKFGFGLLDALALVKAALTWKTVPPQRSCHFKLNFKNGDIPSRRHFKLNFTTDGCQSCAKKEKVGDKCKNGIKKLEHVVVDVTLQHRRRGDLSIDLISPSGTVSHLLRSRIYDMSSSGLKGWKFMTVFNWCENPKGTWQLVFKDNNPVKDSKNRDYEEVYINYLDTKKRQEMKRTQEKENEDHKQKRKTTTATGAGSLADSDEEHESAPSVTADVEEQKYDTPAAQHSDAKSGGSGSANKIVEDAKRLLELLKHAKREVPTEKDESAADETTDADTNNNGDADQYYQHDYRRGEVEEDPYQSDTYRRSDGEYFVKRRKRRDAIKKFDIDEQNEKRMQQPDEEIRYEDPILKKSILAGVVKSISVTFYGTND